MKWMDQAECRHAGYPPVWWDEENEDDIDLAVQICSICSVQTECLQEALRTNEMHGVWGGLTSKQRMRIPYRR